ncbi:hypothetical protein CORC01_11363 [Colletotrichum orchidophilum]|uniref:Uncharacterized protein n=1 Tax=Colletotrichum orchidophilum TaxID=1209926 RepID=A0A1G4AW43_9PEZI|nr:uncharacterized protein CORC01_11363 [Colletotrichum orchidophilum]OHE93354.1 hypothetical protein CORC01_11363 [Colletotrichum orchidophilum]
MTVRILSHVSLLCLGTTKIPRNALLVRWLTLPSAARQWGCHIGKDPARQTPMLWACGPGFCRRKWTLSQHGAESGSRQQKSTKWNEFVHE